MDKIDYIEFPAASIGDLAKTTSFLAEAFGWEFQQWGDDYADTKSSGVGSGVNAESPSKAPLAVIHVADINAAYGKVRDAGGIITKEIFSFPGGKRFHFTEPAGNELGVWSE